MQIKVKQKGYIKVIRWLQISLLSVFLFIGLIGCNNTDVSEETAEKYIELSEEVITLLNSKQYEELIELFDRNFRVNVTKDGFQNIESLLDDSGDFVTIEQTSVEREEDYYVVIHAVKYSKEHRIFTIKYDHNDEVSELLVQ